MAEKTQFINATLPPPDTGVMCCFHCRFSKIDPNLPLGTFASQNQFVSCQWGPPSVVVIPIGIDPRTGAPQLAYQSKFPAMGYREFCHRFETRSSD